MKKIIFGIIFALAFVACNKIEEPYTMLSQQEDVNVVFPELDPSTVYRKILFDEYTGHYCTGCPEGHNILNQLLAQYGDTLVAIGIHADWFAKPRGGILSYDFRTEAGEQLYHDYNIENNPQAIINRNGSPLEKSEWHNGVKNANRDLHAAIQIINQFNESRNKLKINTKTTLLENYDQPVQLSLLLVEDNIVKPQQLSYYVVDTFYVHNHVLRAGINGTYGEYISPDGLVSKDSAYLYGYSIDFNGHDWVPENCSVIAILLDQQDKKVLQVEKAKVK